MSDSMDLMPQVISLLDEDGKELSFEVIDAIEYKGSNYLALVPYNESEEDGSDEEFNDDDEFIILKESTIDDEKVLSTIINDDEFTEIGEVFLKRFEEMFDEADDINTTDTTSGILH